MDLEQAISMIKVTVKNNGTNDSKHIDLGLIPVEKREQYEKALRVVKVAILEGKLTQEEFATKVHLSS